MSVQITVLENGRWVTRSVDPYHVRSRNTETPRKEETQPSISLSKPPSLGILTKTLVRSAVINRIIPARIRHKTKNDVIFISANSVTIKEARGDYTLGEIATKTDFDSAIKSARIIGEQRELTKHDSSYQMLNKHSHWDDTLTSENIDTSDEGDLPDRAGLRQRELPPHILVLALESNRLVFLCAVSGASDQSELFWSQKALPAPTSPLQSLGELMAVDPKSRAMAVAAYEGRAYVYALKSMNQMKAEFQRHSRLEPIREERLISLDGQILKMEFLYPPENESNRVILLFVIAKSQQSRLICYDWNADIPLHQSQFRPNKIALHADEQLPLLLIPLIKYTAFILVCEKRMVLIKGILTGNLQRFLHRLVAEQEPQEPGMSYRRPIWVQWARPMRSKKMRPNADYILLCREDGIVQYMVIDHGIKQMIDSNHNAGRLGVNINTSFATVDLGVYTEDLLVIGGDESDGGLWGFPPRQKRPNQRGIIPNWSPIDDFAVANVPTDRQDAGTIAVANNASEGQQRLFACSGRGKHGAISELRYGVEALKGRSTVDLRGDFSEDLKNGVLGIWAFHGLHGNTEEQERQNEYLKDVTYIILSNPLRTYLLRLWLNPNLISDGVGLPEADVVLIGDEVGLDLNARTIAAGRTSRGAIIQVTETSLIAASLPLPYSTYGQNIKEEDTEDRKPDRSHVDAEGSQFKYTYPFGAARIIAACLHTTAQHTITVIVTQQDEQFHLEFGSFANKYQPKGQRIQLHAQPSCLSFLEIKDELLLLVCTLAGEMEIYLPSEFGSGLVALAATVRYSFAGPFGICDSIATVAGGAEKDSHPLLVCGLRNGTVETLNLSKGVGTYQLSLCEKLTFGHTSVNVLKDTTTNRVVVHCENTLCTLEYPQEHDTAPAKVLKVWITDLSEQSFHRGNISAINQVVSSWLPGGSPEFTARSFVCIDEDQLYAISLSAQPKMIPLRQGLGGSPVRVLYSNRLNKLIVVHNKVEVLRAARHLDGQFGGKRVSRPMISFLDSDFDRVTGVDVDAMDIDDGEKLSNNEALMISECKSGEKILGITEWFPKMGGEMGHTLVINTMLTWAHKPVGRLLFYSIAKGKNNQSPTLVMTKTIDTDGPIYAVAIYSNKSVVYCCGNDLYLQSIGVAEPPWSNWPRPVKLAMRSPGRHISVREPYIYVSSSRESLSVYRYDSGQLVYQFGDQSARCGLHHLYLSSKSLVVASDMSGTVVGLWQPPEQRIDNAMATMFEAVLQGSITRLRRINRPVWSSNPHKSIDSKGKKPAGSATTAFTSEDEIILGSSADGTLTQMSILSSGEWRLLRFLQNMAERHPLICPFQPGNPHKRHIEPSAARPHYMHINGDILDRIVDRGSESLLNDMLDVEPDPESHTDFGSKEERRERFEELAKDVLKDAAEGEERILARTMQWLRYQLRSAL